MFSSILEGAGHDAGLPRHGGEVWREENPRPDVQEMAALSKTCRLRTIVKTVPVENISLKFKTRLPISTISVHCHRVKRHFMTSQYILLQKTVFSLVKSRLALGSPSYLADRSFVTILKKAQYTGKWLLTVP